MDSDKKEKLMYLLPHIDDHIEKTIYDVLKDSEVDPHFSAITTYNMIHCYLAIAVDMGYEDCENVTAYMQERCFSSEEISRFMHLKEKESSYYTGKQYD